jgi:hypothetical protein
MMVPVERVAGFIEAGGNASTADVFAGDNVAILENFAPYHFTGTSAVRDWSRGMRSHLVGVTALHHRFGHAKDFSRTGDQVFFSLPTEWSGLDQGKPFTEKGGWSFVLTRHGREWRIRNYGWAVTESSQDE